MEEEEEDEKEEGEEKEVEEELLFKRPVSNVRLGRESHECIFAPGPLSFVLPIEPRSAPRKKRHPPCIRRTSAVALPPAPRGHA